MAKIENEVHFEGQIAQKAFIENDAGQVLLVQYPFDENPAAGKWDLPGGRLNINESPLDGVKREVHEEIGAEIIVDGIITTAVNVVTETFKLYIVVYRAKLVNPMVPLVAEENEIGKIEWHDKEDLLTLPMLNTVYTEALKANLL